ncbi:MAG: glycoside hydrolase family 127 protein [Clostridiales bacterium]|nr:glycoside hydrolase family 127 protein [Clostridiales bacterium]
MFKTLPLKDIQITDPFFTARIDTARKVTIPYMWDTLNDRVPGVAPSHCIENFEIAAGLKQGEFHGFWFQDTDLWKWIEGVAYSLATHPDAELEKTADEAIDLAGKAQQEDGYLDTYYIVKGLDKRFTNLRDHHEMYVAGHMFEAAVAYYEATGKRKLLDMACRVADCFDTNFGPEENKLHGYPGHQEIELGLAKLYRVTGEERYIRLAKYFLDVRGQQPHYYDAESIARGDKPSYWGQLRYPQAKYTYNQAHKPVREQKEANGHAVRQLYMLSGMADVGEMAGDPTLVEAADTVFRNIIHKQMYITGGVGSTHEGEAFSFDYDLPPERCYTETCASIALAMTASRLNRIQPDSCYGDTVERTLYNGILSGVSLDGTRYFYINPLEVWPDRCVRRQDMAVDPERMGWFGCACCPPNVLRTLTGLGNYIYASDGDSLLVDQYIASKVKTNACGQEIAFTMEANFPWCGSVKITMDSAAAFRLMLRKPWWANEYTLAINGERVEAVLEKGYLVLENAFAAGDVITLDMPMEVRFMSASLRSPNYAGKTALMRGPVVYCLEEKDNGQQLWNLSVKAGEAQVSHQDSLMGGVTTITCQGLRTEGESDLYTESVHAQQPQQLTFVPYYAWGNRGKGEMTVWVRRG